MTFEVVSVFCGGPGFTAPGEFTYRQIDNRSNVNSPCQIYQDALMTSQSDIIAYAHDDVRIYDRDWISQLDSMFSSVRSVCAVGLGGATGLGNKDLYRKPYSLKNMARSGYCSNQDDAEVHGERFKGVKQVAVLDAFFMAIRRDFLMDIGGWPVQHLTHHCLDLWLACEAARHKKEIWMTGLSCVHYGGRSSTKPAYAEAKWLQGGDVQTDHRLPHRWLGDEYPDVLPLEVK